jgi:pimeloyl-ACP methyl ester carboxylesterase
MPILRINAIGSTPQMATPELANMPLSSALPTNLSGAPVLIMLHGYRYSPSRARHNPHDYILKTGQDHPAHRAQGWPRRMGYGTGTPDRGLCIAFGWEAGGTIWRAHREAGRAGIALANLITQLAAQGAGPVNIIAHSLGARVALAALPRLSPGLIGRMILLTGAELRSTAEAALMCPAGRYAKVLNVISRENDIFDFIYEWLLAPHRCGARALGAGLALPHCVTAQIDHPDHLAGLRALGFPVGPATHRMCHWSSYLRPGLFGLYRAFLDPGASLDLADLRRALPAPLTPRWSRLLAPPMPPTPFAVR